MSMTGIRSDAAWPALRAMSLMALSGTEICHSGHRAAMNPESENADGRSSRPAGQAVKGQCFRFRDSPE
jgi:hypothetical protein